MSPILVLALFVEGATERRFLSVLIRRTAEHLLYEHGLITADVNDPIIVNYDVQPTHRSLESRILEAAKFASACDALIVHADSDFPTRHRAYQERFLPGAKHVTK